MKRGIVNNSTPLAQFAKLVSEIGELGDNIAKERDVTDDIGDCLVVLNTLAIMNDTTLEECLKVAYDDIKDRKGQMNTHGVFIKEGDVG
jgi:NTP pyrophosphatase (non-canonical NTP hydrolase)